MVSFVRTVALVMLQLQSESSVLIAPENLTVSNSTPSDSESNNVVFILKEFDITEFQGDTMEILLLELKNRHRTTKKSNVIYILVENATYRVAQRNTDASRVSKTWARGTWIIRGHLYFRHKFK